MARLEKDLDYYRQLPYRRTVGREEQDGEHQFVAHIAELPAIVGVGRTRSEALVELDRAFDSYIEANLGWKLPIVEPEHVVRRPNASTIRHTVRFKVVHRSGQGTERTSSTTLMDKGSEEQSRTGSLGDSLQMEEPLISGSV